MSRWPQSKAHIDDALAGHFLMETNMEIQRLDLPALEPLAKRARMEHVNESQESQVTLSTALFFSPLYTLITLFSRVSLIPYAT